ncbi:50S ribosomal protein L25 [Clostridium formicaceticum]|uniref:Large ribosomal subunit protein bL25 n=1 Tax=Clostridium formicaceticum TaxID=1497 RepID=A0AAC9RHT2_9CLOT|nr:50S ribosomal protein L25 [Clostridium formicaceticum]AOY75442.1 5S rRNA E-loop-binding protein [Clostridium formicaceticum]ARE85727.1 General stress protein CTC [Clostridium formicaceticum]
MISSISSSIRDNLGTNSNHRLRKSGYVPAVIYGKHMNTLPIEVNQKELDAFIRQGGENSLIEINIGGQSYTGYIKEIQRDPLTKKAIHLDFQQVNPDEKIHISVPVILKGRNLVEKSGVVVQQQLKEIEIECSAGNIPKKVEFDISFFKPGDVVKVADVEFGEEISIVDGVESIVASIATVERVIDDEGEAL